MRQRIVCLLPPRQAEDLEQHSKIPNCEHHLHIGHEKADAMVASFRDERGNIVEGYGQARTIQASDGRRRITPLPRILRFVGVPEFYAPDGARGASTMQPVYESFQEVRRAN